MLDSNFSFKRVVKETLDDDFMQNLQSCLFVPFLHKDTPMKCTIPKSREEDKYAFYPDMDELTKVMLLRQTYLQALKRKE